MVNPYCKNCTTQEELNYIPSRCLEEDPHFSEDPRIFSCESKRILEIERIYPCNNTI